MQDFTSPVSRGWTLRNNKVRTADKQFHGQMMFYSLVTLDVLWNVEPALVAVHYKSQYEVTGAAVEEAILGWRERVQSLAAVK